MTKRILSILTVAALLGGPVARAHATDPFSASAFRNSVGVNTHIVYFDTAYGQWARVVAALQTLGVRHLRDGVYGNPSPQWQGWNDAYYSAVDYAAAHGLRFDFGLGEPGFRAGTLNQLADVLAHRLRGAVEAVEDPNEFDQYGGLADWAGALTRYDHALYQRLKADRSLRSLPVVGPSFSGADAPAQVGDQHQWLNIGNIHPYTGGQSPSLAHTRSELARASVTAPGKPVWVTEAGFHNAVDAPAPAQPGVPEGPAAIYTLRTLLEDFRFGIARTYLYELMDETPDPSGVNSEEHFGLLHSDFTPKPAYSALHNLLELIGDGAPAGGLRSLPLTLSADDGVRELVFENANGSYAVVFWRLASVWDTSARRPLRVGRQMVGVTVPAGSVAKLADPVVTATPTPLPLAAGTGHLALSADPVVMLLTRPPGARRARRRPGSRAAIVPWHAALFPGSAGGFASAPF